MAISVFVSSVSLWLTVILLSGTEAFSTCHASLRPYRRYFPVPTDDVEPQWDPGAAAYRRWSEWGCSKQTTFPASLLGVDRGHNSSRVCIRFSAVPQNCTSSHDSLMLYLDTTYIHTYVHTDLPTRYVNVSYLQQMAPIGVALIGGGIFVKNEHLVGSCMVTSNWRST